MKERIPAFDRPGLVRLSGGRSQTVLSIAHPLAFERNPLFGFFAIRADAVQLGQQRPLLLSQFPILLQQRPRLCAEHIQKQIVFRIPKTQAEPRIDYSALDAINNRVGATRKRKRIFLRQNPDLCCFEKQPVGGSLYENFHSAAASASPNKFSSLFPTTLILPRLQGAVRNLLSQVPSNTRETQKNCRIAERAPWLFPLPSGGEVRVRGFPCCCPLQTPEVSCDN